MGELIGLAGFGISLLSGNPYVIAFCAACLAVNLAFMIASH